MNNSAAYRMMPTHQEITRPALAEACTRQEEMTRNISIALNAILADVHTIYLKTKNFGRYLNELGMTDEYSSLDEHAKQLISMTDPLVERIFNLGKSNLCAMGHIARVPRGQLTHSGSIAAVEMISTLCENNRKLAQYLRDAHNLCSDHRDITTLNLLNEWIDTTERRVWTLTQMTRSLARTSSFSTQEQYSINRITSAL